MNQVFIRIDVRSSLSLIVFAVIAIAMTIFILIRAEDAIREIEALNTTQTVNTQQSTTGR